MILCISEFPKKGNSTWKKKKKVERGLIYKMHVFILNIMDFILFIKAYAKVMPTEEYVCEIQLDK